MNHIPLDPSLRLDLAHRLLAALQASTPGSVAELRGSLATGRADAYSDIDLLWEVPDKDFPACLEQLAAILSAVQPLDSLRRAPELQNSLKRRLVFVQFRDLPLFWRLDLDIYAFSVHRDAGYDLENPHARGDDWSLAHSALMNAIAAIRALLRGRQAEAEGLLQRAFARLDLEPPPLPIPDLIPVLCTHCSALDPGLASLSGRIIDLHRQVFLPPPPS